MKEILSRGDDDYMYVSAATAVNRVLVTTHLQKLQNYVLIIKQLEQVWRELVANTLNRSTMLKPDDIDHPSPLVDEVLAVDKFYGPLSKKMLSPLSLRYRSKLEYL
jgi:hypothetical protein